MLSTRHAVFYSKQKHRKIKKKHFLAVRYKMLFLFFYISNKTKLTLKSPQEYEKNLSC